jgi:hypothetical protein
MKSPLGHTLRVALALSLLFALVPALNLNAAEAPPPKSNPYSQTVSALLAPTLKRANEAFRAKNYELVLKELDAAEAMHPKTAFDQTVIDRIRVVTNAQLQKSTQ